MVLVIVIFKYLFFIEDLNFDIKMIILFEVFGNLYVILINKFFFFLEIL